MAQLYADENFDYPAAEAFRQLGHDVLTAQEDGRRATPDRDVLARAHSLGRAVLTFNRRDFERLHRQGMVHSGMIVARHDRNSAALAGRIDAAIAGRIPGPWCIRVNRKP